MSADLEEHALVDTADSLGPAERLGDLLLPMAGRVDDDAVNTTREMLGTGHVATAAEFLVGCLLAGRIPVTAAEREQLAAVLDELRCPREFAERLDVVDGIPDYEHRFSEQPSSGEELLDALDPVASRLTAVRGLWCAWRTTPAGVTYGAVPQRILLAEVGSDGSTVAAGYQLVEALRRAGISCAVDVFATGTDLPAYHRDALGSARRVHLDLPAGAANGHASPNHGRSPRTSSSSEPAGVSELSDEPLTPPPDPVPEPEVRGLSDETPGIDDEPVEGISEPVEQRSFAEEEAALEEDAEFAAAEAGISTTRPEIAADDFGMSESAESAWAAPDIASSRSEEIEQLDGQTFEQAVKEFAGTSPSEQDSEVAESAAPEDSSEGESNMKVPAAVDAKLTDRERNLLRKLHEELAQREHDRDGNQRVANQSWSEMPGTGGFPQIGAGRPHRRQ
jgi:hypothetical protein